MKLFTISDGEVLEINKFLVQFDLIDNVLRNNFLMSVVMFFRALFNILLHASS